MGKKLLTSLFTKTLLFTAILFGIAQVGYSQSLSAGDVAIIGFNTDADDNFAFVALSSISGNQDIYFSDANWDGTNLTREGSIKYTTPSGGLSTGTVVTVEGASAASGDQSVNIGSVEKLNSFDLSNGGEQLYVYLGDDEDTPTTWLYAVTNKTSWDTGELNNTGLTDGSDALSNFGGSQDDNAQYIGVRTGTKTSLLDNLSEVVNNWETSNGSGDQSFTFDDTDFSLVDPPTIAFTATKDNFSEGSGTVQLSVELVEANSENVDVDVVYLGSSSTTSSSDISGFSSKKVSFTDSDGSGTTNTVDLTIDSDTDFEGTETAVFQLQNISTGSIIEPSELTVSIEDDDTPAIVINEFLADPTGAGDANGDGTEDGTDDEFIELVNNSSSDVDLSGWRLSDNGTDIQHTFPDGTVLSANRAIVVFAGGNPTGDFGGALVQTSGGLSLNNAGDNPTLLDDQGTVIQSISYGGTDEPDGTDQSITRDPDKTGNFVNYTDAPGSTGSPFSPGTQIDGTAFGSKHAIAFRGTEGWRMVSSPVKNATFANLFGGLWMQGVPSSDNPSGQGTLYSWTESGGGTFTAPTDMFGNLTPGQGYIVYAFEDDEYNTPGIQGGFPKIVSSDNDENTSPVEVSVSASDDDGNGQLSGTEGFNLLGNPYDTDILVDEVLSEITSKLQSKNPDYQVNANVHVWNHETGNYEVLTEGNGETIAPFQGFWVRVDTVETGTSFSVTASFNRTDLAANTGTEFYKNVVAEDAFNVEIELHGEQYFDTYSLVFNENGTTDLDRYDAYKLFSLNANSINLYSTLSNNRIQKNVLPRELESALEIPLSFDVGDRETLTFQWKEIKNLPSGWTFTLIDKETNREMDLTTAGKYQFTRINTDQQQKNFNEETLLNKSSGNDDEEPRFVLSVQPKQQQIGSNDIPESIKLNPNYPNPFNPQTTIPYELSQETEVKLTVWNMIGQKVATLVDGMVEAGTHEETWNASNMPSGIYIARFEVGGKVFTRKMTLIK